MVGERISRRKLAAFVADKLASGTSPKAAIEQAAAYLIETNQTKEVELLVRDIEEALLSRGVVVADVTTARPLGSEAKEAIARLLHAKELHLRETVDTSVLGGLRLDVSGQRYDGTVRRKLNVLKSTER